jgi:hypothetical protein
MENTIKIIFEFPSGLRQHSVVSWIIKISTETCCLIFWGEEGFFGVNCVELSDSIAVNRVNGLQVTFVEDILSTLFFSDNFDMDMSYARMVRTASLTSYPVRCKIFHQRTASLS